jgi:putative transposase
VLSEHDLPTAPSTYHAHQAQPVSDADWDDAQMANAALDLWRANRSVYGADKLATAMRNAGYDVGRDQVARLMKILGIEGVRRGRHRTVTTRRDPNTARHPDLIGRAWSTPTRPDQWWAADFTYLWTLEGFVGGIKRSSQHLESEVVHGATKRLGSCGDGTAGDAVAGSAAWLAA